MICRFILFYFLEHVDEENRRENRR